MIWRLDVLAPELFAMLPRLALPGTLPGDLGGTMGGAEDLVALSAAQAVTTIARRVVLRTAIIST